MSQPFSDHFSSRQAAAVSTAASALRAAGFTPSAERRWKGATPKGHVIEVVLPPSFPDHLPEIHRAGERNGHIAHVERSGKLCVAPQSGTLLDTSRPDDIVRDAIERADKILEATAEEQRADIEREFESYWVDELNGKTPSITSICPPAAPTGAVWFVELEPKPLHTVVAADSAAAWEWARATRKTVTRQGEAFFVRLVRPLVPPPFHKLITLRDLVTLVEAASSAEKVHSLKEWLHKTGLPATLVLSAPLHEGGDVLVAAYVPPLIGETAKNAQKGFRPGKVPPKLLVARAMGEPVHRVEVSRADPEFILPRGGAVVDLRTKTVAVIGCGSVGSHTASALAASGIGHLILVDSQTLQTENIHRHVLGAAYVGQPKVMGLTQVLRSRFPHLRVTEVVSTVEDSLNGPDSPILGAAVIVFALGEENVELQLNAFLRDGPRRLHVWLDPLGVGGHVLRVGAAGCPGCFACLFRADQKHGPLNMASFVAPNQKFQRSLAGCAGAFTPFGALDAERAGIEAAREVIGCLTAEVPQASITSWIVSKAAITNAGYHLSTRGQATPEGLLVRLTDVARPDCPVCPGDTW